jgi:hypothetical protein
VVSLASSTTSAYFRENRQYLLRLPGEGVGTDFVFEGGDAYDRAEDLFAHDLHIGFDVCEDRGLYRSVS